MKVAPGSTGSRASLLPRWGNCRSARVNPRRIEGANASVPAGSENFLMVTRRPRRGKAFGVHFRDRSSAQVRHVTEYDHEVQAAPRQHEGVPNHVVIGQAAREVERDAERVNDAASAEQPKSLQAERPTQHG
jgi:hypothetical protein